MNKTHRRGVITAAVVSVFCVLAIVLFGGPSKDSGKPAAAADRIQAPTPAPSPTTVPSTEREEKLHARVGDFITKYYRVKPADTELTHREYLRGAAPYIPEDVLKEMYFGLEEESNQLNRARWEDKLSLEAKVDITKLESAPAGRSPLRYKVLAPVTILILKEDGSEEDRLEIQTNSEWTYESKEWQLAGFTEFSGESDAM